MTEFVLLPQGLAKYRIRRTWQLQNACGRRRRLSLRYRRCHIKMSTPWKIGPV